MRGQFGLTTLIIFIALIISAAVAASVIIYTTQILQQQALQTGAQAKQRVSTGIEVIEVLGYQYNSNIRSLDHGLQRISAISPIIRLMSGSPPINFKDITILLTTDKGKFYSISVGSHIPTVLHGRLEGENIKVTGFIYNNRVDVKSVPEYIITDSTICNKLADNTYIIPGTIKNTSSNTTGNNVTTSSCYIKLNEKAIENPLPIKEVFRILEEMREYNVSTPSILIALSLEDENVYLDAGEIYGWIVFLEKLLAPEERYYLQILPKNGYVTPIYGNIPTALRTVVEDIWVK